MNQLTEDLLRRQADASDADREGSAVVRAGLEPPGRHLPRPVFLSAEECAAMGAELVALLRLLVSLPDQLTGGDLRRFATMVGLTDRQADVAVRTTRGAPGLVARPDLLRSEGGFQVVETNPTASVGLYETGEWAWALLRDPVVGGIRH